MYEISSKYELALNDVKFADLFSGIGAFRLALESFGANCVFSSEIDKYAVETYKANFGDVPEGDIRQIPCDNIPDHDVLCAGFPCQSFSISGNHGGFDDTRGTLFFEIAKIARQKEPPVLFLENVEFLRRHDKGRTLETIIQVLGEIGYKIHWEVLNASYFGVPQYRRRMFLVCLHKDKYGDEHFEFPEAPYSKPNKCVADILIDESATDKYVIERNDIKLKHEQIEQIGLFREVHDKPVRIGIINKGGQGERIYSIYGQGITLSAYGGGVAAKTGAYFVDGEIRKLAPRECARMMGFPDDFEIVVSDAQAWKQFGNSVVVDVFQYVIETTIKQEIFDKHP